MKNKCIYIIMTVFLCMSFSTCIASEITENPGTEWDFAVSPESINQDYIMAVNSEEPLSDNYTPVKLISIKQQRNGLDGTSTNVGVNLATSSVFQVAQDTANALYKMTSDAAQQGVVLYLRQAYRSFDESTKRYERLVKRSSEYVAPPSQDDFRTGTAVVLVGKSWRTKTLDMSFSSSAEAEWIKKNCSRYGFILRYPEGKESVTGHSAEPWHLRYVGEEIATYIATHNLSLEEFLNEYQAACTAYEAKGGNLEDLFGPTKLPDGPVILKELGPDGDYDVILFHD